MISTKNITYSYKKRDDNGDVKNIKVAINDITLDIKKGEFVVVAGANGSGKSTFAKHLNAIILPDKGDVYVKEYNTKDESKTFDIRKTVGMVFQNPDNQIIASIVEEDVAFGPENIGVPTEKIEGVVDSALNDVSMLSKKYKNPNYLSGGQKQRIAIAGVLAINPECIVFDEPTAMLDPKGRADVINIINKLNKEYGVTIILITHYMDEIQNADRVVIIDNGRVVKNEKVSELFANKIDLSEYDLLPPFTIELVNELEKQDIIFDEAIINREELIDKICKLK